MDVLAVETAARRAAERCAPGPGRFLELHTYRFRAHSMADPDLYRAQGRGRALEGARPDRALRRRGCARRSCSTDDELAAIEAEIAAELDEAVAVAEAAPWRAGRGPDEGRLHAERGPR